MKKVMIGASFILITFQSGNGMAKFASFKDAVLRQQRNIMEEIAAASTDKTLSEATKARKIYGLYTELRNQYRGKEQYSEYNARAYEYRTKAESLEQEEKEAAQHARELAKQKQRAQDAVERAEQERFAEQERLVEKIKFVKRDAALTNMQQWQELNTCYQRLLEITCANENKEQYAFYQKRLELLAQKKPLCALQDDLKKSTNKSEQADIYRQIGSIPNTARAQEYIAKAQALEEEVKQECIAKANAERDANYQEASILLSLTTAAVEKIELYRRLVNSSASEQQAQENNAHIKALEAQIAAERKKEASIDQRLKQISDLSKLILKTDPNTLNTFIGKDTLAGHYEKRAALSKGISTLENNIAFDLSRAQKLRRESAPLAPNETTRLAIMRSLQS